MIMKLVGIVILLFAVGMAIPSTRARISEKFSPLTNNIKARIVPRRLEAMADQIVARGQRGQPLPTGIRWESWLRRDYSSSPFDPWQNQYYLVETRRGWRVGSMGPDGVQGNDDDIFLDR